MIHNVDKIEGYSIHATDDELGKAKAFLFDDEKWTIRYLVADTRKWLPGRKVLISPISFKQINHEEEHISVNLTKQQVKDSPDIDTDRPVSREQEMKMNQFYGWGNYWGAPGIWGPAATYPNELAGQPGAPMDYEAESAEESHLRKTSEIEGYQVHASDGDFGHVESFLIDDDQWKIRYLIIDTKTWGSGKKLLISPAWVTEISWAQKRLHVAVDQETIREAPEYDPDEPITKAYEQKLSNLFNRS